MIKYNTATTDKELRQILRLQAQNLPANISPEEARSQGFVTVRHDFELLKKMNSPYPHIIAKDEDEIVGYALVMLRSFAHEIPVLVPMFEQLDTLVFENKKLAEARYFVMGQICIDKKYRGKGIFAGMYGEMKNRMSGDFDYIITEVAAANPRSLRAHEKVGFKTIHQYFDGENWEVVLLPCGARQTLEVLKTSKV